MAPSTAAPLTAPRRRFAKLPLRKGALTERPTAGIEEAPPNADTMLRDGVYRRALALSDALMAGVVVWLVAVLNGNPFTPALLLAMPLIVAVNKVAGLYDRDELVLNKTTLDEAPSLMQISGLFVLVAWLLHAHVTEMRLWPTDVLQMWVATFVLLIAGRGTARAIARRFSPVERCLMIGDRESIASVREKLDTSKVNACLVGSVPLDAHHRIAPLIDRPGDFSELVRSHQAQRVIVAPQACDAGDTLEIIRLAKAAGVRVTVLPRLLEVVGSSVEFDQLDGMTMLGVRQFGLTRSSKVLKRAFDMVGAGLGMLAIAPVFAVIALAVKLESRGPVFFRQVRVGRDGERFHMLKFRSMVHGADDMKEGLRHLNEARQGLFKIADDPRVTRVGRFLRKTSLDELPQLLNVCGGKMSLVGPRPLVVDEDAQVEGLDRSRLHLTPGMTGHWQILGSARIPMAEMVGIDYVYVANWSLWADIKILLRTVPYVLARRSM
jgi:exopolysaccharide biosynthesis polyprenyl glycosylphosphotransferase